MPQVDLSDAPIRLVEMDTFFSVARMTNWGPVVWYTPLDRHRVERLDLLDGARETVSRTGTAIPWNIDTNGSAVVWGEWDPRPGRHSGWRVVQLEIATGKRSAVDEGISGRSLELDDMSTALDVDGDLVAYSVDAPTSDNPLASAIVVRRISTGGEVRRIETQFIPYDVAINGGGTVLYSEGKVNTDAFDMVYETRLMVSTTDEPASRFVSDYAYEVALDGDRLMWNEFPPNGTIGPTTEERVMSATLPDIQPVEISRPYELPGVGGSHYSVAAEGIASWSEASDHSHHLIVWDAASGDARRIADAGTVFVSSIGGGWVVWHVYMERSPGDEVNGMFGVSLNDLRQAAAFGQE